MKLVSGEPHAGPWRVIPATEFADMIFEFAKKTEERPCVVAVDGRSGSGKTTISEVLHSSVSNSAVVHTDDIAWHHSFFDWNDLLVENILKPLRAGKSVKYRPPGWITHGRSGSIEIDANLSMVIVEGVGASRTEVMSCIDCAVWIQSDFEESKRRGLARDGDTEGVRNFWDKWMSEEVNFLQQQQPWYRAKIIVNGTPARAYNRSTEVVVSPALKQLR